MQDATTENWRKIIKKYNKPINTKSNWQIINSFGLYIISWYVAYFAYDISIWLCAAVALLAQVFFGRIFIIMHDCGHGSFFKSKRARTFWGYASGIVWWTPYWQWTKNHAIHHKTSGNLDKRGIGDVWVLTVKEYLEKSPMQKFLYRVYRFPLFLIIGGSVTLFMASHRFTRTYDGKKERRSVHITNIAIVLMGIGISLLTSVEFYLFYQFSLLLFGGMAGVICFYVQHQYEDVYWKTEDNWDYEQSAILGSSYLKLPKILQWASGNIGFHHIHHLSHTIPNYRLETAYNENRYFQNSRVLGLKDMYKCFMLTLIDEDQGKMITFSELTESERIENMEEAPQATVS